MKLLRVGMSFRLPALVAIAILFVPAFSGAEEYSIFNSEKFGFSMKYPSTWNKVDEPKANYYVVFMAPEMKDGFRSRINVAAHKPTTGALTEFLQEFRNAIKRLEKNQSGSKKQQAKMLDEGAFKCDVPGAYYFFIEAYENVQKLSLGIVIVYYKHKDTLLRISCLAPSKNIEHFHKIFNDVLVSVKFTPTAAAAPAGPAPPAPAPTGAQPTEQPAPAEPPAAAPRSAAPAPSAPAVQAQPTTPTQTPSPATREPQPTQVRPAPPERRPAPPPRTGPRGPARAPERPATGIVN